MSICQKAEFSPWGLKTVEGGWRFWGSRTRNHRPVKSEMLRMLEIQNLSVRESKNLGAGRVLRGRGRPSTFTQDADQPWCSEEYGQEDPRGRDFKGRSVLNCQIWVYMGGHQENASKLATRVPRSCKPHVVDGQLRSEGKGHPRSTPHPAVPVL